MCFQHKYIRSKNKSDIVEHPKQLCAISIGISCAIACLESIQPDYSPDKEQLNDDNVHHLARTLENIQISPIHICTGVLQILKSQAIVDILNNASVKFAHGDINSNTYLQKLKDWAVNSWDAISLNSLEIPEGLPQGDLYCPCFHLCIVFCNSFFVYLQGYSQGSSELCGRLHPILD